MRTCFTIVYNGLHHLQHKGFAQFMADNFDLWVVVDGYARNVGSTSWCKRLTVPASSTDGTIAFMKQFAATHDNVQFYAPGTYWHGKDMQVNFAVDRIREQTKDCMLWQVDCDEQWTLTDIKKAEALALKSTSNAFCFQFNQYVGPGLIATGHWGSGAVTRLWKWKGEFFTSHEPASIIGQTEPEFIDGLRFEHYSYYFAQDVLFKSLSYRDHENVHRNWLKIQNTTKFPIPIHALFGIHSRIGKTKSYINPCVPNLKDAAAPQQSLAS